MCETKCNCEHPERMNGTHPDDCTLGQIRQCNPELYKKIMSLWEKENTN